MQMSGRLEEARAVYDTDESFKEHIRFHPILFDACQLGDFFAITNKLRLRYNDLSPEDTTSVKQKEYIKLCTHSLKAIGSCNNKITTIIKAELTSFNGADCTQFLNWLLSLEDILQNQHDAVSSVSHFLQINPNRFGNNDKRTPYRSSSKPDNEYARKTGTVKQWGKRDRTSPQEPMINSLSNHEENYSEEEEGSHDDEYLEDNDGDGELICNLDTASIEKLAKTIHHPCGKMHDRKVPCLYAKDPKRNTEKCPWAESTNGKAMMALGWHSLSIRHLTTPMEKMPKRPTTDGEPRSGTSNPGNSRAQLVCLECETPSAQALSCTTCSIHPILNEINGKKAYVPMSVLFLQDGTADEVVAAPEGAIAVAKCDVLIDTGACANYISKSYSEHLIEVGIAVVNDKRNK